MKMVEVLVILIIVYLFLTMTKIGQNIQGDLNINLPDVASITQPPIIITETETIVEKANLCSLMQPYLVVTDFQATCVSAGGEYRCDSTGIGCYGSVVPLNVSNVCNSALYQTSAYQCQSVGGISVCDSNNLYCEYT